VGSALSIRPPYEYLLKGAPREVCHPCRAYPAHLATLSLCLRPAMQATLRWRESAVDRPTEYP